MIVNLCAPRTHPTTLHLFLRESQSFISRALQERILVTQLDPVLSTVLVAGVNGVYIEYNVGVQYPLRLGKLDA
jgi:hypothetical protein